MGMTILGEFRSEAYEKTANGLPGKLQIDKNGNLRVVTTYDVPESHNLVAAATSTTGKIGTIAATTGELYVVMDCSDRPISLVDWLVTSDNQWTYQFFRAHQNPLQCTLVLTDATAVDADDTFVLNGLTFTYKAGANVLASRYIGLGADNGAAAVNTVAMLNDADYGVPGVTASVVAGSGIDTITIIGDDVDGASALQFAQGTSAANEVAYTDATAANLWIDAAVSGTMAVTTGNKGRWVQQTLAGWEFAIVKIDNIDGDAQTLEVRAVRR